jgi:hypothetical protein
MLCGHPTGQCTYAHSHGPDCVCAQNKRLRRLIRMKYGNTTGSGNTKIWRQMRIISCIRACQLISWMSTIGIGKRRPPVSGLPLQKNKKVEEPDRNKWRWELKCQENPTNLPLTSSTLVLSFRNRHYSLRLHELYLPLPGSVRVQPERAGNPHPQPTHGRRSTPVWGTQGGQDLVSTPSDTTDTCPWKVGSYVLFHCSVTLAKSTANC